MNKLWIFMLTIIAVMTQFSCNDEVTLMSAIQNGDELKEGSTVPFLLFQNYPNPFNQSTTITYQVAVQMHLQITVFTDDWQEVKILVDSKHQAGEFKVQFDGRNSENELIPSSEYFYTLNGNGFTLIRKMKLVK